MMHCQCCGKQLAGKLDTFGDAGAEMCQSCYWQTLEDYVDECQDCAICHKHTAYEKDRWGYPGLYHCTSCGFWYDVELEMKWRVSPV